MFAPCLQKVWAKMKRLRRLFYWVIGLFFGSTVLAVVVLRFVPVYVTPLMLIRCYQQVREGRELKLAHHWVPMEEMASGMPIAVIASEDANFFTHHGFDYKAIASAAKRNMEHPEKQRLGGSTISQQTAKNVFLWPGRSWVRKGFEVYFTFLIELVWSKERILEVYLNSIEMGDGIYGAEAVAREHFNTHALHLTDRQCALIAATLPNPRRFSSKSPSPYMQRRQARILREMAYVRKVNGQRLRQSASGT